MLGFANKRHTDGSCPAPSHQDTKGRALGHSQAQATHHSSCPHTHTRTHHAQHDFARWDDIPPNPGGDAAAAPGMTSRMSEPASRVVLGDAAMIATAPPDTLPTATTVVGTPDNITTPRRAMEEPQPSAEAPKAGSKAVAAVPMRDPNACGGCCCSVAHMLAENCHWCTSNINGSTSWTTTVVAAHGGAAFGGRPGGARGAIKRKRKCSALRDSDSSDSEKSS